MQSIRQVQRLNDLELEKCVPPNASWHTDYRDTAYIYIGGLPFDLSEGDVLTIFSQYGNPVHINLVRDKETGKSRGFCFLKYEDQRSCDLAVDNLSGAGVMGRVMSVDHTRYKKKDGEIENIGDGEDEAADDTDREGAARRKRQRTESESEEDRPLIKEEVELQKLLRDHDDDDPMKAYLVEEKKAEVEEALRAVVKTKDKDRKHGSRHHRSQREDERGDNDSKDHRRNGYEFWHDRDRDEADRDTKRRGHKSRRARSLTPDSDYDKDRRRRRSRRDDGHGLDEHSDRRRNEGRSRHHEYAGDETRERRERHRQ